MANNDMRRKLAMMLESSPVIVSGTPPIMTIKHKLLSLKAYGGTEQNGTPTPANPVDIVCNNGVLTIQVSSTGTVTQTGNPTPTEPVYPVFYKKGNLILRAVGEDADTYDADTQTITRNIGYHIFTGTETFNVSSAYGRALYISSVSSSWGAKRSKDVLCQYFFGTSSPSSNMPEFSCFFNSSGHFYFRTEETATNFKAWLSELYENGTPLIVWFVKGTTETESFTPTVYADGTVETIAIKNNIFTLVGATYDETIGSNGNTNNSANNGYSDYLAVTGGDIYNFSNRGLSGVALYDQNKVFQSRPSVSAGDYTIPAGIAYIRVNFRQSYMNDVSITHTNYIATAEMLLKVGDYQDVQSILDGVVTRNVGVKALDGTENWVDQLSNKHRAILSIPNILNDNTAPLFVTHGEFAETITGGDNHWRILAGYYIACYTSEPTLADFKAFLADQYAAGTPVIVVYPLDTPTTEQVIGQTMTLTSGTNVIDITQASLDNLELEVKAK